MTEPSPKHPLEILSEVINPENQQVGPRTALFAGVNAIHGLMELKQDPDGDSVEPVVIAAAIQAVGNLLGNFASGQQTVRHQGRLQLDNSIHGHLVSGSGYTRMSGELTIKQAKAPSTGKRRPKQR